MDGLINWMGSTTCEAFAALGAEHLLYTTCSAADRIFGLGLITSVMVGLVAIGAVAFVRR